jgi:hypothetical protein
MAERYHRWLSVVGTSEQRDYIISPNHANRINPLNHGSDIPFGSDGLHLEDGSHLSASSSMKFYQFAKRKTHVFLQ